MVDSEGSFTENRAALPQYQVSVTLAGQRGVHAACEVELVSFIDL